MGIMSERHDDLVTIRNILLGQRKVAQDVTRNRGNPSEARAFYQSRIECINDLLFEIEAAGIVWPDNVVELGAPPRCACRGIGVCIC